MTQEEKSLLLQDLCARLPYGVKVQPSGSASPHKFVGYDKGLVRIDTDQRFELENIKPYLRPMSSMTDKEKGEFSIFIGKTETYRQQICLDSDSMGNPIIGGYKCVYWGLFDKCIDWLNSHHFDYHGLIEKGLALEAKEGMYEKK